MKLFVWDSYDESYIVIARDETEAGEIVSSVAAEYEDWERRRQEYDRQMGAKYADLPMKFWPQADRDLYPKPPETPRPPRKARKHGADAVYDCDTPTALSFYR